MAKYEYNLEYEEATSGMWRRLPFGLVGLEYGRGYIAHHREAHGPRLGMRLVRSDGRVMDEALARTEVDIGMVAGWPSWQQYAAAAVRALHSAERVAEGGHSRRMTPDPEAALVLGAARLMIENVLGEK